MQVSEFCPGLYWRIPPQSLHFTLSCSATLWVASLKSLLIGKDYKFENSMIRNLNVRGISNLRMLEFSNPGRKKKVLSRRMPERTGIVFLIIQPAVVAVASEAAW